MAGLFTGTASAGNDTDADAVTSNSTVSTLAVENAADDTFAGRLAGSLSLDKFGAGTLTLTGDCTTEEPALVYDGTLDVEGILLATAQTVAGYGNPQLVLPGDPDYDVVVETSGTGPSQEAQPSGSRGYTVTGYLSTTGTAATYGDNWQEAVQTAVTAEVTVEQNNSNSTIYDGALSWKRDHQQHLIPAELRRRAGATTAPPIGTPFLIGTAGDIDALIPSIYRGTDLVPLVGMTVVEQNGATITLAAGTQVICMEDEIGQPQCDFDYNDAIWVLQVQQVPPAVTAISPTAGRVAGGTAVTITGTGTWPAPRRSISAQRRPAVSPSTRRERRSRPPVPRKR